MKKLSYLILISFLIGCQETKKEENKTTIPPLYIRMADSELLRNPDPRLIDFREKPKWEYTNGLLCLAILKVHQKTGNEKYLDYVKSYADSMIMDDGDILTYKMSDFNIDRINPGRMVIRLNELNPEAKYQKAIDTLRKQMEGHPKTSEGGFWHKKRYPHQMWLDGLYMGSPFLTKYAIRNEETDLLDVVANQFALVDKYLYVSEKGLYKHGWDESHEQQWADKETGRSPHFWGRAMGWHAMAIVDVLEEFPVEHPKRSQLIETANRVAEGITKYQDQKTGLWWQVLDKPNQDGNYLEASCSSMFTYFLLSGVKQGILDATYLDVAKKAHQGIIDNFIKENPDGTITLTNVCSVAGLGGNPYRDGSYEYYVSEPQRDNDPKGVGPFIMMSLIMEEFKK
ncbi:MAG: unsaturated rhamnogalacturonyl hydrolase [Cyclobacteriaceae bacterium]|jgi:unsaturated rhamnogalacturonyl hydrolase